jgi:hypothetical protein
VADISGYGKIRYMNDQTSDLQSAVASDTVQEIYRVERDKLERSARIKTFVSVLAHRRVKALLQVERGHRH